MCKQDNIIREYDGLRNAITQKIQLHNSLTTFMITSVIAVFAFALGNDNMLLYLLPFGIIIPVSMRIAYYRSAIAKISAYIMIYIEEETEGLNWETRNYNLLTNSRNKFFDKITSSHYFEGLILGLICYGLSIINLIERNETNLKVFIYLISATTLIIWEIVITKRIMSIKSEKKVWVKKWKDTK